jgi:hypothetical protein
MGKKNVVNEKVNNEVIEKVKDSEFDIYQIVVVNPYKYKKINKIEVKAVGGLFIEGSVTIIEKAERKVKLDMFGIFPHNYFEQQYGFILVPEGRMIKIN